MDKEIKNEEKVEGLENNTVNETPVADKKEPVKKKKQVGKIIYNVIVTIFFLIVVFEAAIGIVNMQRINDEKKPVWYISKSEEKTDKKEETTYNLGLYKIVKTETSKRTKIALKPFFMK